MARKTIVALEDDLDGGPADETVRFGVGGSDYEIDLSEKNAAKLRRQLAPFVDNARRASGGAHRPVRTAASRRRSRDIRAWARNQGIQLSERGRIPAGIAAQYEAEAGRSSRRLAAGRRARRGLGPVPPSGWHSFPNANAWFGSAGRRAAARRAEQPGELEFACGEQGGLAELAGFGPGWLGGGQRSRGHRGVRPGARRGAPSETRPRWGVVQIIGHWLRLEQDSCPVRRYQVAAVSVLDA